MGSELAKSFRYQQLVRALEATLYLRKWKDCILGLIEGNGFDPNERVVVKEQKIPCTGPPTYKGQEINERIKSITALASERFVEYRSCIQDSSSPETVYFIMTYYPDGSLHDEFQRRKFSEEEVLDIYDQLSKTLHIMRKHGINLTELTLQHVLIARGPGNKRRYLLGGLEHLILRTTQEAPSKDSNGNQGSIHPRQPGSKEEDGKNSTEGLLIPIVHLLLTGKPWPEAKMKELDSLRNGTIRNQICHYYEEQLRLSGILVYDSNIRDGIQRTVALLPWAQSSVVFVELREVEGLESARETFQVLDMVMKEKPDFIATYSDVWYNAEEICMTREHSPHTLSLAALLAKKKTLSEDDLKELFESMKKMIEWGHSKNTKFGRSICDNNILVFEIEGKLEFKFAGLEHAHFINPPEGLKRRNYLGPLQPTCPNYEDQLSFGIPKEADLEFVLALISNCGGSKLSDEKYNEITGHSRPRLQLQLSAASNQKYVPTSQTFTKKNVKQQEVAILSTVGYACPHHICRVRKIERISSDNWRLRMKKYPHNLPEFICSLKKEHQMQILMQIFMQVLYGLRWMNNMNFRHYDVKPENILVDQSNGGLEIFLLCDFGISASGPPSSSIGTPGYMAVEMIDSPKTSGVNADIMSLGVTIVSLLAQDAPPHDKCKRRVWIEENLKNIPSDQPLLRELIEQCLIEDPSKRPSAKQLLYSLLHLPDPVQALKEIFPDIHNFHKFEEKIKQEGKKLVWLSTKDVISPQNLLIIWMAGFLKHIMKLKYCFQGHEEYAVAYEENSDTLEEYLNKYGSLSKLEVLTILRKIFCALSELHAQHIIHGNINLKTIFIRRKDKDGNCQVLLGGLERAKIAKTEAVSFPLKAVGEKISFWPDTPEADEDIANLMRVIDILLAGCPMPPEVERINIALASPEHQSAWELCRILSPSGSCSMKHLNETSEASS